MRIGVLAVLPVPPRSARISGRGAEHASEERVYLGAILRPVLIDDHGNILESNRPGMSRDTPLVYLA